jgi:phage/plasmid-like protein (TIGR03299 family)
MFSAMTCHGIICFTEPAVSGVLKKGFIMSHELTTRANGAVEFAYLATDGAPWHGLGKPMGAGATIDQWRVDAGMDWSIGRSRVRYGNESNFRVIEDQHVLFRSDTKDALGIVSKSYKIVQPGEVLEFFRDIVKAGGLELSAAGTIQGGRRFWATAKIGEAAPTSVQDKIGGYLLLSTSADGSLATEARLTSIRVVCKNTLQFARAKDQAALKISHRSVFDPAAVKESMGLNTAAWDAFRHNLVRLANVQVDAPQAEELVAALFATGTGELQRDKARETAGFKKVLSLFNGAGMGSQLEGVFGTANGVLQAVTEYADHHVRAHSDENRFIASQWGGGATLKQRAWDQLIALA